MEHFSDQDCKHINSQIFNIAVRRWMMNEDQMATDKLSEGIRKFAADQNRMDSMVRKLIQG